jgi:hypothetical protein
MLKDFIYCKATRRDSCGSGENPGTLIIDEKNEVDIRIRENVIREEQGVPLRVIPLFTPLKNNYEKSIICFYFLYKL